MNIRKATKKDLSRVSEIYVFNNRVNYWPIFKDDGFSFGELQVVTMIDNYFGKEEILKNILVYDDGLIKGFIQMKEKEICKIKIYVNPNDKLFENKENTLSKKDLIKFYKKIENDKLFIEIIE